MVLASMAEADRDLLAGPVLGYSSNKSMRAPMTRARSCGRMEMLRPKTQISAQTAGCRKGISASRVGLVFTSERKEKKKTLARVLRAAIS